MQNTLLPAIYGTIAVVVSLPVYWIGLKTYGLFGVALAVSFSAIIQVTVLFAVWNRRSHNTEGRQVYISCIKTIAAGVPMGVTLWVSHWFLTQHIDPATFHGSLAIISGVSLVFLVTMAIGGWIFKVEGIQYLGNRILGRLRRTPPTQSEPVHRNK